MPEVTERPMGPTIPGPSGGTLPSGESLPQTSGQTMTQFRTEKDSMGDVQVPAQAYYSAQTQRAVENFPISGWKLPAPLIHALGLVKLACATANRDLGKLTQTGKNKLN